jgi:hypothetical protein
MNPVSGSSWRPAITGLAAAALVLVTACASSRPGPGAPGASPARSTLMPQQALRAAETDADHLNSVVDTFSAQARGALPSSTTGTIRSRFRPTLVSSADIRSNLGGVNSRMRSITTDDAVYMNAGPTGGVASLPGTAGKPWIKFGLTGLKAMAGAMAGAMAEAGQAAQGPDISVHLRLSQLAKNVHVAGTQLIDGVLTTEYAGSYRPADVLNALPASERKKLTKELPSTFSGSDLVSFREWIDGQHHLRKRVEVGTAAGTTTTSTDHFTAFNQPVHVTLPPASQVMTVGI